MLSQNILVWFSLTHSLTHSLKTQQLYCWVWLLQIMYTYQYSNLITNLKVDIINASNNPLKFASLQTSYRNYRMNYSGGSFFT